MYPECPPSCQILAQSNDINMPQGPILWQSTLRCVGIPTPFISTVQYAILILSTGTFLRPISRDIVTATLMAVQSRDEE